MTSLKLGVILLITLLIAFNVIVWVAAVISFHALNPSAIGYLLLAWTLGLRHGFDADHILAIDNVTRAFLQTKKRPLTIGLYFALGHSTIVIIATFIVVALSGAIQDQFDHYSQASSIIGPTIAASFLILMALINAYCCFTIIQQARQLSRSSPPLVDSNDTPVEPTIKQGLFHRLFSSLFKSIRHPWHMYPMGCLFGLGFDTASEIILLSVASLSSSQSHWIILYFALLFTAGMILVDTMDGLVMLKVYHWSMECPSRRLYFNLLITFASFLFALFIALLQILGIIQEQLNLQDEFWLGIQHAGEGFEWIGLGLVASFVVAWIITRLYFKYAVHPPSIKY